MHCIFEIFFWSMFSFISKSSKFYSAPKAPTAAETTVTDTFQIFLSSLQSFDTFSPSPVLYINSFISWHSKIDKPHEVQLLVFHYHIWFPSLYHVACFMLISHNIFAFLVWLGGAMV